MTCGKKSNELKRKVQKGLGFKGGGKKGDGGQGGGLQVEREDLNVVTDRRLSTTPIVRRRGDRQAIMKRERIRRGIATTEDRSNLTIQCRLHNNIFTYIGESR